MSNPVSLKEALAFIKRESDGRQAIDERNWPLALGCLSRRAKDGGLQGQHLAQLMMVAAARELLDMCEDCEQFEGVFYKIACQAIDIGRAVIAERGPAGHA